MRIFFAGLIGLVAVLGFSGCAPSGGDDESENTGEAQEAMPKSSCSASAIYSGGSYVGCYTIVDGYGSFSDPSGLTERGCSTFCAALD